MRYSPNLPIEEQRRLDQLHLGMGSGNPYREGGLASINPFAQSQFPAQGTTPPAPSFGSSLPQNQFAQPTMERLQPDVMPQPPGMLQPFKPAVQGQVSKDMYDSWTPEQKSEWDRYGEFGKLQPIDMPRPEVMPNPFAPYTDDTYPTGDETRPPVMLPQPIDMPRPPVMLPLPGQENPYPVGPIRPEVMPSPGTTMPQPGYPLPGPPNRPPPDFPPFVRLPTGQQQSGLTYSDDEKIRPPSIQLSRKHGGSLSQTVLNLLRNLS